MRRPESPTTLRVLVVEDDAALGMLLAETLEDMGHDVCAIEATEAGAVTAAARYRPDLMTVDVRLRDGSGISAIERILRTGFVPHVFVSGDSLRGQALTPGAVVIHKPFRTADLARAIDRALRGPAAESCGVNPPISERYRLRGDGRLPPYQRRNVRKLGSFRA